MAATICPKCGHLEHKSRMHQNICTHYIPADGAECGCSYQRPQPDPAEAERKPASGKAWEAVVIAASHVPDGDCARLVAEVTGDYLAMRRNLEDREREYRILSDHVEAQDAALEELMAAAEEARRKLKYMAYTDLTPTIEWRESAGEVAEALRAALAKCREVLK